MGTAVGWASRDALPTRRGARPGDAVVTTGWVGHGGAYQTNIDRLLRVLPRVREGQLLARAAHSMTDTSDGIAEAARLIADGSRCRVVLVEEALPLHPRLRVPGTSRRRNIAAAFYGGDYELFATISSEKIPALVRELRREHCRLTVIGRVERGRGAWLERNGRPKPMPTLGWRHFESR